MCFRVCSLSLDLLPGEQGIVFCQTVEDCISVSSELQGTLGPDRVCVNHADLATEVRREQLNLFVSGKAQWAVATSVLGCGLDVPDVKLVVHAGPSFTLDDYAQQAGRGGRGHGTTCDCYLFWWRGSLGRVESRFTEWSSRVRTSGALLGDEARVDGASAMLRLVKEGGCTRSHLRAYLDGEPFNCFLDLKAGPTSVRPCAACEPLLHWLPQVAESPSSPQGGLQEADLYVDDLKTSRGGEEVQSQTVLKRSRPYTSSGSLGHPLAQKAKPGASVLSQATPSSLGSRGLVRQPPPATPTLAPTGGQASLPLPGPHEPRGGLNTLASLVNRSSASAKTGTGPGGFRFAPPNALQRSLAGLSLTGTSPAPLAY